MVFVLSFTLSKSKPIDLKFGGPALLTIIKNIIRLYFEYKKVERRGGGLSVHKLTFLYSKYKRIMFFVILSEATPPLNDLIK